MGEDTPGPDKHWKERGFDAKTSRDPTLASYLSSLLYLLALPGVIVVAYVGYWQGLYSYDMIIPVLAGLLIALFAAAFAAMHVFTSGR